MKIIEVADLTKKFKVATPQNASTPWGRVGNFFLREWTTVMAVNNITFDVAPGEAVAFLGPNGAGKTTTIKMLTGILTPSAGSITVAGFNPQKERYRYTYHIGLVMGQKSMLIWDIPVIESLRLYKDIYNINDTDFQTRIKEFSEILEIDELLHIPVRKLSLGQRMRAEIVSSLLHRPKVIFLDEPTIGLDLIAKRKILSFLKTINKTEGVTFLLTTHNIQEVEQICNKVILIDKGSLIYNGSVKNLEEISQDRILNFEVKDNDLPEYFTELGKLFPLEKKGDNKYSLRINRERVGELTQQLSTLSNVAHVAVESPDLEDILADIYEKNLII